jgi:gliding motility-associated-like protein
MEDIASVIMCNTKDSHTIAITGLTPGVESYQKLTLSVAITSKNNKKDLFEQLSITQPEDGLAEIVYQLKEGRVGKDTLTVTLKDDGGALNNGSDTYEYTFTIEAYQLDLFISSETGTIVPRGGTTTLRASSYLAQHFTWLDGPGIIGSQDGQELTVRPTRGYEYTAVATTDEGCERTATVTVLVDGNYGLDPGNILTPNGDGKNDTWVIWNISTYPGAIVRVIDMSGREVYSKKNYESDWDGTYKGQKLAEGAYYYIIDLGGGIGTMRGSLNILYEQ